MFIAPNLQLSSAAFHLFESVRNPIVPSGRFSCRSQVSYHILVYYFITRTRATRLAKHKLPSRFRQVLRIVSRRTRRPISMSLVPIRQSNLDMSLLLLLQLQGCTTAAKAHPILQVAAC